MKQWLRYVLWHVVRAWVSEAKGHLHRTSVLIGAYPTIHKHRTVRGRSVITANCVLHPQSHMLLSLPSFRHPVQPASHSVLLPDSTE